MDVRGTTEASQAYFKSTATLPDYVEHIKIAEKELGIAVEHVQTNDLNECISRLSSGTEDAVVINPAGFMMESELVECLAGLKKPVIEVHYGNFFAKGKHSEVTKACNGIVAGAKLDSYTLAMRAAIAALQPEYTRFDYNPEEHRSN
eukprot:CAMPEP_0178446160 /NCGR_PEP_ID=MMETSP0689_2-20121128/40629_1 /TAXON_ID=160604 /ORGANISM="Amphidinium massartii, Strain CS-259" /LENGTH=146 /DNA_ID=CAMNT_0020070913 /DNA_START=27 /DNA_END=465 /DNA_ORIENTATION=-